MLSDEVTAPDDRMNLQELLDKMKMLFVGKEGQELLQVIIQNIIHLCENIMHLLNACVLSSLQHNKNMFWSRCIDQKTGLKITVIIIVIIRRLQWSSIFAALSRCTLLFYTINNFSLLHCNMY